MQREIKFRFWSTINEQAKMIYPTQGMLSDLEENRNWKVMQFTGLKDKNGKEIYEGDIINNRFEVKFNQFYGAFMAFSKVGSFFLNEEIVNPVGGVDNPIVTGNIYENPELLDTNEKE